MARWLVLVFSSLIVTAGSPSQTGVPKEAKKQSIQGKVVEAKSVQPIRKVNVEVIGGAEQSSGRHSAMTGADGTFTIEDLTPGRYMVTLERGGFVEAAKNRSQMTFTLQPGQSLTGLVFRMQAAGVISGKIVDVDGDPLARVTVTAAMPGTGEPGLRLNSGTGTTNDLGEYRIADLRPGKYLISATPQQGAPAIQADEKGKANERMIYASTYFPGTLDKSQAVEVEVHAGEEASANFGVHMTRGYRVTGTVIDVPTGAIVRVFLASKNGDVGMDNMQELTEGNRFEYQNVVPGKYVGMLMVVKGLSGGQPDMQMVRLGPPIEVDKADVEGVKLQAEPGGQIHGRFRLDTEGKFDWTQLFVSLLPVEENSSEAVFGTGGLGVAAMYSGMNSHATVSVDGTFEMKNVPGGTYQLLVGARSDNLRDYYSKSVMVGGKSVTDSGFAVNGDLYLDVVVSAKGAAVEGNVVDSKGKPVAYATVAMVPNSERRARPDYYQQQTTDEHGHFIARGLSPGSYVVLAFEELQEDMRQPEFLKTYRGRGERVELEEASRKSVTVRVIPNEPEAP